jgi:hypothetical protein
MSALDNLLGPEYNYSDFIKPPESLGMSSDGNMRALTNDIGGLMSYVGVLVNGNSNASTTGRPLGSKFFIETPMSCNDTATGKSFKRSIYINNVPDGSIPFISNTMGGRGVTNFKGLVPGLMSNMAHIHPLGMVSAFTSGSTPDCQQITMETIDGKNKSKPGVGYVTHIDMKLMNPSWFSGGSRPELITTYSNANKESNTESFTTITDYSKMPDDLFVKLYYSSLGLIGIYLLLNILLKKKIIK